MTIKQPTLIINGGKRFFVLKKQEKKIMFQINCMIVIK